MKKSAALVVLFISTLWLPAQPSSDDAMDAYKNAIKVYEEASQQLQRSNLRAQKKEIVNRALSLNSEQARAFWPVYDKYEEETIKINDTRLAIITDYVNHKPALSAEKAAELINRMMQVQNQRHEMKRRYVKELATVLTAGQALRLLILENQLDLQVDAQIAAQIPL